MTKFLKYLRRSLAALIGGLSLIYFIDIVGVLPTWLHTVFHIQIVPAIISGSIGILIFMALLTLIFGRVYCSVFCPLGILQDFMFRVKKWYLRIAKKRKNLKIRYKKPLNAIRYTVLAMVAVPFALGISYPLMILDPYSNFGRIAVSLFKPIVVWVNNILASVLNSMGNYWLYNISQIGNQWFVTLFAALLFVVLLVMVWRRGRLWCNTMCPVGTMLGLISRFSLFRISLGKDCNSCGMCSSSCKANCIDPMAKTVDGSRCVTCFNCLDKCVKSGVKYAPDGWRRDNRSKKNRDTGVDAAADLTQSDNGVEDSAKNTSRRQFLTGAVVAVAALPTALLAGNGLINRSSDAGEYIPTRRRTKFPLPPGAIDRNRFVRRCTACQLCVSKCPTHVLQPAVMENGIEGMMQPYMNFKIDCFCNYECKVCTEVCPNHAIVPITLEQKKLTRVGYANFKKGHCVVFLEDQDCGACAEHCPSQAVHMVAYKDGLTIPQVEPELCIGCGGCESICPVSPPAIFVQGIDVQNQAAKPAEDKIDVGEITDFGF